MSLLYKGLVCPKLEVGMSLASTDYKKRHKVLEVVQRHATKVMSSMQELSYPARLPKLKLLTLVYRRERGNAIF
jgi:hypothetical protein